jgi:hypothetical protein
MSTIFKISPSTAADAVDVADIWSGSDIPAGLTNLIQFPWDGGVLLLGQAADGSVKSFQLSAAAPFVKPVAGKFDLGGACDILQPFVIGGQQHVIAYRRETPGRKKGELSFHRVNADLTLSKPFIYYRLRSPGLTTGWTMMQPLTYLGMVYYLTYDFDTGIVEMFNVNVTANAADGVPPLQTLNVWSWTWAMGWKHFAFFQFGGENFFFKINVKSPNVNIDHLTLDPNQRSNEVCTQKGKEMPDNQDPALKVRPLTMARGAPYLVTYMPSGQTTFFRVASDCQGWTKEAERNTVANASDIVTYRIGDQSFALFY